MKESKRSEVSFELYLRVIAYLRGKLGYFLLSILGFLVFGLSQPMLAKLMEMTVESISAQDSDARWFLPLLAIAIFLVRGVGSFVGAYFNAYVGGSVIREIKLDVFNHLTKLPADFYEGSSQGQLLHNLSASVERIQETVTGALKTVIREGITIVALVAYVFYLNWKLSLMFFAVAPLLAFLVRFAGKKLRKFARKNEAALGDAMRVSKELIGNYSVVRAFGAQDYEKARYQKAVANAYKTQMKIKKVGAVFTPISQLVVALAVSMIIFLLLSPSMLEHYTAGELVGYLTAIGLLPKSIRQLSGVGVVIQRGLVGAEMVFKVLDVDEEEDTGTYEVPEVKGDIEFVGLSFRYASADTDSLKGVTAAIRAGETIALVGVSGSGKSTLASLICRQYRVGRGGIFLDGVDINDYKLENLRRHISVVDQSVSLFDDTVRNNIVYGVEGCTDAQVHKALERAHVSEFVSSLPKGLDTQIGEKGLTLSGGQRQRLSIARALLKSASVLILDEATSALDNDSEAVVSDAIGELSGSCTTIVIAHRLSTILKADRLLVMEGGRIVEEGTHEMLLRSKGAYYKLFKEQHDGVVAP